MPSGRKRKKKGDIIDVRALLQRLDYGRWDHPTVMKAFQVLQGLNEWINRTVNDESAPAVIVGVSAPVLWLSIGDHCVWHSEEDQSDDLNIEYCKDQYKEAVLRSAAVLEL